MKDRDLKHRINGAKETVKITRAMQLVSASKMTKAERRLVSGRNFLYDMEDIVRKCGEITSPLAEKREVNKRAYIVVASDKGLCGDYNHKILDYAVISMVDTENTIVYPIGHFARDFFKKCGQKQNNRYVHFFQGAPYEEIRNFAYDLAESFLKKELDEVFLVYTEVGEKSAARQVQVCKRILPMDLGEQDEEGCLEYPIDTENILKQLLWAKINFAICNAELAVNYKSMAAMQQATTNGEELVEELARDYNRLRQEKITNELLDASVSGNVDGNR